MELSVKCNNVDVTIKQEGDQIIIVAMAGDELIDELTIDCAGAEEDVDMDTEVDAEVDMDADDEMTELDEVNIGEDEDDELTSESHVMSFESYISKNSK